MYTNRSVGNRLLYPLVFIVSESHRSGASSSSLFTKIAINNMDIHNIKYRTWNASCSIKMLILYSQKIWWGIKFGSLVVYLHNRQINISYLHIYVWRSLTKSPNLNPPTFLQWRFRTQPPNLSPAIFPAIQPQPIRSHLCVLPPSPLSPIYLE